MEEVGRAALRTPITVGLEAATMSELHAREYLYSSSLGHLVGGGYWSVLRQDLLDFTWRWAESIQFWPYPNATVYALDAPNSITTFRLPFLEDLSQGMKGVWRDGGPFMKFDNVSALCIHGEDMIIGAGNATRLTWLSDYSIWADQGTVPL